MSVAKFFLQTGIAEGRRYE